jgi:hypothetical protein
MMVEAVPVDKAVEEMVRECWATILLLLITLIQILVAVAEAVPVELMVALQAVEAQEVQEL